MRKEFQSNVAAGIYDTQAGALCRRWRDELKRRRLASMNLSTSKYIKRVHSGGVTCLDLDQPEGRYLLSVAADASIGLYDTQGTCGGVLSPLAPLSHIPRRHPSTHKYLISCVRWYPIDSGLFVTGAFDQQVKLWDTNCMEVAGSFHLPAQVFCVALSPIASSHCLIATACQDPAVKLCDPASGAFTHTLPGHASSVWAISWSLTSEYEVLTGDAVGDLRLWDIRRAGCLHLFDLDHTRKRAPAGTGRGGKRKMSSVREGVIPGQAPKARISQAHQGAITCIHPTPDGLSILTAGNDSQVHLWDSRHHHHLLVNYSNTFNAAIRGRQLSTTEDGSVLFHPSGSILQVFDVYEGHLLAELKEGHYESINCCQYNPTTGELYSGANDCSVLVWEPRAPGGEGEGDLGDSEDAWSDDY